ncbi:2-oxoglutarate-dependent dioxygenase AOP2-like [Syzygium oleosum]|uniref:2-oxoglutarate-dependent dioxygenase AOP2-like n=1 Tax=Syzygium oleosum TaxID=219896 RepID=UPI0011D2830F|nr:2-oxoglutarate-dependent dioxygenase AOP2-like [Syzygium oleosum]
MKSSTALWQFFPQGAPDQETSLALGDCGRRDREELREMVGTTQVPVIVFSEECMKPGTSSWAKACKVMAQALEDHGCFVVDHPNVPLGLHDSIFSAAEDLFHLPYETKIKNVNLKPPLGYTGKIPGTPVVEALAIVGPDKPEDCEKFASLMWPSRNDHFCKAVHDYSKFIAEMEKVVFRMVCESYAVEKCYDPYINSSAYILRLLKSKILEGVEVSVNPTGHTDKSFLSYLHQGNIRGLDVRTKDGEWFTFEPSASTFIVMAGEACVAWSNGRIKACDHRVLVTEKNQVRYSLATFSYTTGMIETPEEFIDEAHPRLYKPFIHMDFLFYYDSVDDRMKGESLIESFCGV